VRWNKHQLPDTMRLKVSGSGCYEYLFLFSLEGCVTE
jgi:hypothetical protein